MREIHEVRVANGWEAQSGERVVAVMTDLGEAHRIRAYYEVEMPTRVQTRKVYDTFEEWEAANVRVEQTVRRP